jgi:hypothetical protein
MHFARFAFLLLAVPAFAFGGSYKLRLTKTAPEIGLSFSTVKVYSSICHLQTQHLEIDLGDAFQPPYNGKIRIDAQRNPTAPCLAAFGPHSGGVSFTHGYALPGLPDGKYAITLNGESAGALVVTKESASLED